MPTKKTASLASGNETGQVTTRVLALGVETLNARELQAICNLFDWVAAEQDAAPETVREITGVRFGADNVTALPRKDYDEVIKFLVDLRIDEICN